MTMIWFIFGLLTAAALLAVVVPLARRPASTDARELDIAFYEAQTAEIDRDLARGVIGATEADAARAEAARRLMAARQRAKADVTGGSRRLAVAVAVAAFVFVPALVVGLYQSIGAPGMPDEPLEARLNAPPAQMDMATAIKRIEDHLAKDPNDGRGWTVLAPIYMRLQRFDDAKTAYRNAIRVLGPSADRWSGLGQVELALSGGTVSAEAKSDFEHAVALDPKSPAAAFYLGVAAEQEGDKAKAKTMWTNLLAASPPQAPWIPTVREHLAALDGTAPPAAGGGMGAKMAAVAALPKDQQQAMIHTMVDRLAERLKTNGNDIEGWLRLVRAYRVLDEADKAKVALGDAKKTFAGDPAATKRLDELAHELGLEG